MKEKTYPLLVDPDGVSAEDILLFQNWNKKKKVIFNFLMNCNEVW